VITTVTTTVTTTMTVTTMMDDKYMTTMTAAVL
jgi:hypothetical protein